MYELTVWEKKKFIVDLNISKLIRLTRVFDCDHSDLGSRHRQRREKQHTVLEPLKDYIDISRFGHKYLS